VQTDAANQSSALGTQPFAVSSSATLAQTRLPDGGQA